MVPLFSVRTLLRMRIMLNSGEDAAWRLVLEDSPRTKKQIV